MSGNRMKYAFLLIAVFALIGYSGCILSPDEEVPQPQPKPTYKPLTDKENVIYNLQQCYKEHTISRYDELLDAGYKWHNQDETFYERAKDVEQTGKLFAAANNTYPLANLWIEKLELTIYDGTWTKIDIVDAVPCSDCWETTRDYDISARMAGGTLTYIGNDQATFIVIGIDRGGQRIYQLRHIYDLKKQPS
ncbi:MAG: hypothetical protein NTW97_07495 [Candidatus Krumholzibacteria bacterium]|nr:hypothetical protein [Candidatus Krumholzibacteria bacterium]